MKTLPLCVCSVVLAVTAMAQPAPPPPPPAPAASASVTASASPARDLADRIHQRIEKKLKGHHGIVIDGGDRDLGEIKSDDLPEFVIPIVAITMLTIFGAPVLIVALIMYFGFSKNRAMHRTIRIMAEKGQPIPPALLAPPTPAVRQRSDMRRGVVLCMVGFGLMLFFGAVNSWEGGSWAIGVIPFVIGLGYLLVWKLEGKKDVSSPPPCCANLPAAISPSPTIWPRTLLFVLTKTFAASAAKRNFPPGFIGLPTIAFARTRDAGRSSSELMRNNGRRSRTHRRSIQV